MRYLATSPADQVSLKFGAQDRWQKRPKGTESNIYDTKLPPSWKALKTSNQAVENQLSCYQTRAADWILPLVKSCEISGFPYTYTHIHQSSSINHQSTRVLFVAQYQSVRHVKRDSRSPPKGPKSWCQSAQSAPIIQLTPTASGAVLALEKITIIWKQLATYVLPGPSYYKPNSLGFCWINFSKHPKHLIISPPFLSMFVPSRQRHRVDGHTLSPSCHPRRHGNDFAHVVTPAGHHKASGTKPRHKMAQVARNCWVGPSRCSCGGVLGCDKCGYSPENYLKSFIHEWYAHCMVIQWFIAILIVDIITLYITLSF